MSNLIGYREAVRVKVKKCEPNLPPEWRKFSVDPQITTLEVLYSLLAKAFEVKYDFTISYKTTDPGGTELSLSVLSDFDLDAAFLRTHNHAVASNSDPCLNLRIDIKPFTEVNSFSFCSSSATSTAPTTPQSTQQPPPLMTTSQSALTQSLTAGHRYVQSRLPGLIMNHMEKTFSIVQKALNITDEQQFLSPPRPPLTDAEFRGFLDSVGRIMRPDQLRRVIYVGGIDPGLRRVVWKHILNVYPDGMTGKERMDYMKRKAAEYFSLRDVWRSAIQHGCSSGELAYVTSMVRKDVLRTDRLHPFYAGHDDDNQNVASLFNILTTYALNHPAVSYCQGMSDIASPLLVTMNDEAHAYICFCAVMRRLCMNFMIDGLAMTQKFAHLTEALQFYDPEFYDYLREQQADDLLFCYRWLLLEMKREFAFSDSLRMLEVLWSSLPPDPPETELTLVSRPFVATSSATTNCSGTGVGSADLDQTAHRETVYTKICALRRQNSALSLCSGGASPAATSGNLGKSPSPGGKHHRLNQSLDETRLSRSQSREVELSATTETIKETDRSSNVREEQKFVFPPEESTKDAVENTTIVPGVAKRVPVNTNPFLSPTAVLSPGGHFRELKERLVKKSEKLIKASLSIDEEQQKEENDEVEKTPKRVVKSFNEFLNLATPGSTIKWAVGGGQEKEQEKQKMAGIGKTKVEKETEKVEKEVDPGGDDDEEESSPDDTQEYFPMTTSMTRELRLELESLDRQVFGGGESFKSSRRQEEENLDCDTMVEGAEGYKKLSHLSTDTYDEEEEEEIEEETEEDPNEIQKCPTELQNGLQRDLEKRLSTCSMGNSDVFVWENPLNQFPSSVSSASLLEVNPVAEEVNVKVEATKMELPPGMSMFVDPIELSNQLVTSAGATGTCEEAAEAAGLMLSSGNPLNMSIRTPGTLPPPAEFGGGNPFLMFLSLTLLMQHRDHVMRSGFDYNEMAIHFDKMVRRHNVTRTLNQARQMYSDYLASFKGRLGAEGDTGGRVMV